jgi:hypothetical protein
MNATAAKVLFVRSPILRASDFTNACLGEVVSLLPRVPLAPCGLGRNMPAFELGVPLELIRITYRRDERRTTNLGSQIQTAPHDQNVGQLQGLLPPGLRILYSVK